MKKLSILLLLIGTILIAEITPPPLLPGDTIALVGLGFNVKSTTIKKSKALLEGMGYKVLVGENLYTKNRYFAGNDQSRLDVFHNFIQNPHIKAIFHIRGGYGNTRLLDQINYDLIKKNPKIIMGYSDVTASLIAINKHCNLVTYHGPMPKTGITNTEKQYIKTVLEKQNIITYQNPKSRPIKTVIPGKATGKLIGGNLAVITALMGTPHEPNWSECILFLEDIGEKDYQIDRFLTQLKSAGVLKKINGLILGQFTEIKQSITTNEDPILEILKSLDIDIPCFYNSSIGHVSNQFILPIGYKVEMDASTGALSLLD